MILFAEKAWTSEGRLNVARIHHQIGQNGLSVFSEISKVQALKAKGLIFPESTYKLALNGLCHICGTFHGPQTSNL